MWVQGQRQAFKKGVLNDAETDRLAALPGWVWDVNEAAWDENLDALVQFVEEHGHARPVAKFVDVTGRRLGAWVDAQRQARKKGTLSGDRAQRLEAISGWTWDPREDEWNAFFDELVAYVEEHGTSRVDRRHVTASGLKLGAWVSGTRSNRNRGRLREDRVKRLEALPEWVWSVR
jgi:hypothetical protein